MQDLVNNVTQLGPVAGLLLFLNVVGLLVKRSAIETRWNVWILPVLGAVLHPLLCSYTAPSVDSDGTWLSPYWSPILTNVMYGFILGWGAVGANQAAKLFLPGPETDNK